MAKTIVVEIEDPNCEEGTCWIHRLPADTDRHDLLNAVQTMYPEATGLYIYEAEDE